VGGVAVERGAVNRAKPELIGKFFLTRRALFHLHHLAAAALDEQAKAF
jgi:hypothetical protein